MPSGIERQFTTISPGKAAKTAISLLMGKVEAIKGGIRPLGK
jgi:hypothetical protein